MGRDSKRCPDNAIGTDFSPENIALKEKQRQLCGFIRYAILRSIIEECIQLIELESYQLLYPDTIASTGTRIIRCGEHSIKRNEKQLCRFIQFAIVRPISKSAFSSLN